MGIFLSLFIFLMSSDVVANVGKDLYLSRCSMCHGLDAKASGYLANRSHPPTPDLTSCQFRMRLKEYPGVIISSIVLQPNGTLIPDTLKKNRVYVPKHTWTDKELRSINQYIIMLIGNSEHCKSKGIGQ